MELYEDSMPNLEFNRKASKYHGWNWSISFSTLYSSSLASKLGFVVLLQSLQLATKMMLVPESLKAFKVSDSNWLAPSKVQFLISLYDLLCSFMDDFILVCNWISKDIADRYFASTSVTIISIISLYETTYFLSLYPAYYTTSKWLYAFSSCKNINILVDREFCGLSSPNPICRLEKAPGTIKERLWSLRRDFEYLEVHFSLCIHDICPLLFHNGRLHANWVYARFRVIAFILSRKCNWTSRTL